MNRTGSVLCRHCDEYVSVSTHRRHMVSASRQYSSIPSSTANSRGDLMTSSDSDVDSDENIEPAETQDNIENDGSPNEIESEQESEMTGGDHEVSDSDGNQSDTGDNSGEEFWDEIPSELLEQDLDQKCLREPTRKKSRVQKVTSLLHWLVYFLLIWQSACKLSDNGLAWLLRFLFQFFQVLGIQIEDQFLSDLISAFPTSMYLLWQHLGINRDDFQKFVVCSKCSKLYGYDECLEKVNGRTIGKTCSNTYSKRGRQHICGAQLTKKVLLKDGKEQFYPIHYYCYNSIINTFENMLQRKGFPEKCELWRNRNITSDLISDVYDGQLWKDFVIYKGTDFFNKPRNYGLMLNFDYFQPMKHRSDYSVGILYLVILNLPRAERFKWENVIVLGIIPSMDKEPKELNEFLRPAVDELKFMWNGARLKSSLSSYISLTFRLALLCTSSDIPAARKLCGLKSHGGRIGCSRCYKEFPSAFGEKTDYSGFDRNNWRPRTHAEHKRNAEEMSKSKTKSHRNNLGTKYGISYYSILLELPYFDIIRFCTIDPMHNMFLGTAKKMFKMWMKDEILTKQQLKKIETKIEQMDVPSNIGRLPKKISCNYGSFTAEQWKNWTLIYSLFALKDVLEDKHLKCWQTFVLACKYICRPIISTSDLNKAYLLLLKFGKSVESVYGKLAVSPNMHLHCHLKDVIIDHGPIHSFWCFSFERYNGIMGSVPTNNRSIEMQLMRRLTTSRHLKNLTLPDEFCPEFETLVAESYDGQANNFENASVEHMLKCFTISTQPPPYLSINWFDLVAITFPSYYKKSHICNEDLILLLQVYKLMFPNYIITKECLSMTIKKYGTIQVGKDTYGSSYQCRTARSSGLYASWPEINGDINLTSLTFYCGTAKFYFKHSIRIDNKYHEALFACVKWCKPIDSTRFKDTRPLEFYHHKDFLPGGPSAFIPVQRIHSKCAFAATEVDGDSFTVGCPLNRSFVF